MVIALVTSRWPSVAPYRQYYSPYVGMGNNPVNGVDPDGRDWYIDAAGNTVQIATAIGDIEGYTWIGADNTYLGLDEVVISAGMSVEMADAARLGIYQGHYDFFRNSASVLAESIGKTALIVTLGGLLFTPASPAVGSVLLGAGGSLSLFSGSLSATDNLLQGNVGAAATDAAFTFTGLRGAKYLKGLQANGILGATDEIILRGVQNSSLEITNSFVVPAVKDNLNSNTPND